MYGEISWNHLQYDVLPRVGQTYHGTLTVNDEFSYSFVESATHQPVRRNPIIHRGCHINLHRNAEGYQYPTFTRPVLDESYSVTGYLRDAAREMLE